MDTSSNLINLKVIIFDLCNDRGIKKSMFGYDFTQYESYSIYPNMNPHDFSLFTDYEHWCLSNVLDRPGSSPDTNFLLSPVTSGLNICIRVHNEKTRGILRQICNLNIREDFDEKLSMDQIRSKILEGALRYSEYLKTLPVDEQVIKFVTELKLN